MFSNFKPPTNSNINAIIWLFIGLIISWLFWSAAIVGIEIGDGFLTLTTSQYFLGLNETYGYQRGPFLALYLVPAEWLSNAFNLHPLDVRLHHASTAILHSIYVGITWLLLKNYFRDFDWLVAIAFLATIPSFIFFSYAIFISPDIFPGLILIGMIFLIVKFEKSPTVTTWLALVFLGFLAVTIKQSYAIFWASLLVAFWSFNSRKTNLHLFLAASLSAVLSWFAYAWFLLDTFGSGTDWWLGPFKQIAFVNNQYTTTDKGLDDIFIWWLYLRNFYNYGILTSTLIIPAIIYSLFFFKGKDQLLKIMAIIWCINIIFMQSIPFKEVRYIEYLAPLSAFILVPFFRLAIHSKYRRGFILLLTISFMFDFSQSGREAFRINQPFYQGMLQSYLKPLENLNTNSVQKRTEIPRVTMINPAGFTPPVFSPLKGDRYHRTFHISPITFKNLYGFNDIQFSHYATGPVEIKINHEIMSEGDIMIFTNQNPVRSPPWDKFNMATLNKDYNQFIAIAEPITLHKNNNRFSFNSDKNDKRPVLLLNNNKHEFNILIGYKYFDIHNLENLLDKTELEKNTIELTGFRISRSCTINGCFDMENDGYTMY